MKRELTIFEKIAQLGESIPQEELDRHPPDFARNFHHYMHGHPKQDPDQLRTVYADALYYIALLLPGDQLHAASLTIGAELSNSRVVTCEPVLVEVLAHVSGLGPVARARAVALVDLLRGDLPTTDVIPQTPELFEDGLILYRRRLDKGYSLTDCMSMSICRRFAITEVLTHDRHFEQEGFAILL